MHNSIVEKLAAIVKELPGLPTVAQEVLRQLSVPGTNPAVLEQTMSRDPALSLRVLRMANSAYYRRGREISSLSDAIVLLGFKTIQSLVLSSAVVNVLNSAGSIAPRLWEHCFAVGVACRELARMNGLPVHEREEAFLAGLFHDVAKGVIASRFPGIYSFPKTAADERDLLGFDHAQLGLVLLNKWQIPSALSDAVGGHHSGAPGLLASLIQAGNCVAQPIAPGVAPLPRECPEELAVRWSLDVASMAALREKTEETISEERSISDG